MPKKILFPSLTETDMNLIAVRFRALSEVSRLKLMLAAGLGEKNVTQLIAATGLTQANVSKHLKILTTSGFLVRRQRGIYVYYSTPDSMFAELCAMSKVGKRKGSCRFTFHVAE